MLLRFSSPPSTRCSPAGRAEARRLPPTCSFSTAVATAADAAGKGGGGEGRREGGRGSPERCPRGGGGGGRVAVRGWPVPRLPPCCLPVPLVPSPVAASLSGRCCFLPPPRLGGLRGGADGGWVSLKRPSRLLRRLTPSWPRALSRMQNRPESGASSSPCRLVCDLLPSSELRTGARVNHFPEGRRPSLLNRTDRPGTKL